MNLFKKKKTAAEMIAELKTKEHGLEDKAREIRAELALLETKKDREISRGKKAYQDADMAKCRVAKAALDRLNMKDKMLKKRELRAGSIVCPCPKK